MKPRLGLFCLRNSGTSKMEIGVIVKNIEFALIMLNLSNFSQMDDPFVNIFALRGTCCTSYHTFTPITFLVF